MDNPEHFPVDPEKPRTAHTRADLIKAYSQSDMYKKMIGQAAASAEKLAAGIKSLDIAEKGKSRSSERPHAAADQVRLE